MPKLRAKGFRVRRDPIAAGSVFIIFADTNNVEYQFEISELAFPTLGKSIAGAFSIPQPRPSGGLYISRPGGEPKAVTDTDLEVEPQRFSTKTAPGSESIVFQFSAPNGKIDAAFSITQVEEIFETIGKALTLAKSAEPTSKH